MVKSNFVLPALGAAVLTSLLVSACGGGGGNNTVAAPAAPPVNAAPQISSVPAQRTDQDKPLSVAFTVSDAESPAGDLIVSVDSANKALIPADGAVLSGSGAARSLRLVPLEDAAGNSAITVTARDPAGGTSSVTFTLTVQAVSASVLNTTGTSFSKAAAEAAVSLNGQTFVQDADDVSFSNLLSTTDSSAGN